MIFTGLIIKHLYRIILLYKTKITAHQNFGVLFIVIFAKIFSMISILDSEFSALNTFIQEKKPSQIFILVDENTHQHCLPTLLGNLDTDVHFEIIEIESGEDAKNISTVVQLWEILSDFEADRKSLLLNLGGGVITDLGGFVASTYKRGISFINIPTTLLAMCDASIGGKTGIDHQYLKNIVGTFAEAEHILVYPEFLKTLDFVELRSGFEEMLKHGLIADVSHWNDLITIEELTPENIAPHIENSMMIKENVVVKDYKEKSLRKILNFGHTIGHAVESLCLKTHHVIPHGEAVALGMIIETKISELESLISPEKAQHIIENIQKYYPYISISAFSNEEIISLMLNDKKNDHGKINFSILEGLGKCNYDYKVSQEHIEQALEYYRNINA